MVSNLARLLKIELTSWEHHSQLSRDLNHEESTQRRDEEQTKERANDGDSEDSSDVLLGISAKEIELVHGWKSRLEGGISDRTTRR